MTVSLGELMCLPVPHIGATRQVTTLLAGRGRGGAVGAGGCGGGRGADAGLFVHGDRGLHTTSP